MALIQTYTNGDYIFMPSPTDGGKPIPHTVTIAHDGMLVLDFTGETRARAEANYAAFSRLLTEPSHHTTVECPRGGGVVLKQAYQAASHMLEHLHKAGLLTKEDYAEARQRYERMLAKKELSAITEEPAGPLQISRGVT